MDREALSLIEPPEATETWKPVKHCELVDQLTQVLYAKGREIANRLSNPDLYGSRAGENFGPSPLRDSEPCGDDLMNGPSRLVRISVEGCSVLQ